MGKLQRVPLIGDSDSPPGEVPGMCVAYVLRRFPALSETFVTHEIRELRRAGVRTLVFSLLRPRDTIVSAESADVCQADVYYAPFLSYTVLGTQLGVLQNHPKRYIRAFTDILLEKKPKLLELVKALAIFPKSIYFAQICRELGVSHVHAHWPGLTTIGAETMSTLCDVPFSVSLHTARDIEYEGLQNQIERAAAVRVNTHRNRRLLAECFPEFADKIRMVRAMPTWPDSSKGRPQGNLGPTDKAKRLLAIGRLVEKKGLSYLIEAMRILQERGMLVRCLIVGDGPLRDSLTELIRIYNLKDAVYLMGAVPHEDILVYLHRCDVVIAPSVRVENEGGTVEEDGLPQVILEAMAMGKPVVTTDVGAISEVVRDGVTGLLVSQRDPQRLAGAIERLLAESEWGCAMGRRARAFMREEFNKHRVVQALSEMFAASESS